MRQKFFDGKYWYPPPLIHKLFGYRKFDETQHRMVPLWKSSALSDKKFWQKIVILPRSSHLLPPLIHEFFRYLKFVKHYGLPLGKISALRDKKLSTENLDTAPHLIHKHFDYRKFSETQHRKVPLRKSSALWDKNFVTESRDTPPLLSINFLATGNFLKPSTERFPYGILRHCETKIFWRKILIPPPLIHKLFG